MALNETAGSHHGYHIATFDWEHVSAPYTIGLWILLATLAKIGKLYIISLIDLPVLSCLIIIDRKEAGNL